MVRTRGRRRIIAVIVGLAMSAGFMAFAPAANAADVPYTCAGRDAGTQGLLDTIATLFNPPGNPPPVLPATLALPIAITDTAPAVVAPGEVFHNDFSIDVTMPAELTTQVAGIYGGGPVNVAVNDATGVVNVTGATPASVTSPPVDLPVTLVSGVALTVSVPSFGSNFTTTAPHQGQIDFVGGLIDLDISAPPVPGLFPAGLNLALRCTPDGTTPFSTVPVVQPGPPVADDAAITVALGGTGTVTLPIDANPAVTAVNLTQGSKGTATVQQVGNVWKLTYVHNQAAGDGTDTVGYQAVNAEGSDTGEVDVTILGNVCEANPDCSLQQLIETTIEGDVMTMEQDGGSVELEDPAGGPVILNGEPQTAVGALNQLTITNRRGDGAAWSVTGQVTDFTVDGYTGTCAATAPATWDFRCIPGDNLTWSPATEVAHLQVPGDVAASTPGSAILASEIIDSTPDTHVGTGLGSTQRTLCQAAATVSGGTFACGAGLGLVIPASASEGTYSATITLTLV